MEQSKQEEYYQMAIEWANNFLETNEPMIDFVCFDKQVITNSHNTLQIWVARLQLSKNREKHASFIRIKKFKDWYNEQYNEN